MIYRRLFSDVFSKTVAQNTEVEFGNVTELLVFNEPDDEAGEPTSLQRLIEKGSALMYAYRVMCDETKEMMDILFSKYLMDDKPHSDNVASLWR